MVVVLFGRFLGMKKKNIYLYVMGIGGVEYRTCRARMLDRPDPFHLCHEHAIMTRDVRCSRLDDQVV